MLAEFDSLVQDLGEIPADTRVRVYAEAQGRDSIRAWVGQGMGPIEGARAFFGGLDDPTEAGHGQDE